MRVPYGPMGQSLGTGSPDREGPDGEVWRGAGGQAVGPGGVADYRGGPDTGWTRGPTTDPAPPSPPPAPAPTGATQ